MTGYSLWNIPEKLTLKIKKLGGRCGNINDFVNPGEIVRRTPFLLDLYLSCITLYCY
jgi:hypothetical protein